MDKPKRVWCMGVCDGVTGIATTDPDLAGHEYIRRDVVLRAMDRHYYNMRGNIRDIMSKEEILDAELAAKDTTDAE